MFESTGFVISPTRVIEMDEALFQLTLEKTDIVDSNEQGDAKINFGTNVQQRHILRDAQTMACDFVSVWPASPLASACKVVEDASLGAASLPPVGKRLWGTCIADILPEVQVPCANACTIFYNGVSFRAPVA